MKIKSSVMALCRKRKVAIFFAGFLLFSFSNVGYAQELDFETTAKEVSIVDGGLQFQVKTSAKDVKSFLLEQKINLKEKDIVFPSEDQRIYDGSNLIIHRAKKITVIEGGEENEFYTLESNVENALLEQENINIGEDDIIVPARNSVVKDGMKIKITHVEIKEETKKEPVVYKIVTNEDDKLSWRTKKVTQKGENGINEIKYKVVYYDGKEISRKILEKNKIKDPVDEVITQGTFVKVGKSHTGQASWYAYTGTLSAANPWLPMGSYVKVTNKDNGKSVIVKINDRGPFGKGRIIDLDKVAFEKIASLGQGVANVKMEEITN